MAARRRLAALGASTSDRLVYGCDIDPGAFKFLVSVLGEPVDADRFRHENFLALTAGLDWPVLFDATIGNPPYIAFQAIEGSHRRELLQRAEQSGVKLGGRASLWAHFLIHAVSFVAPNGRMAWVLPGSFLQADYAANVREYLGQQFGGVVCILMHQRFFKSEGTEEETVVLLAKDRGGVPHPAGIRFVDVLDVENLQLAIDEWELDGSVGCALKGRPSFLATDPAVSTLYSDISSREQCSPLGEFLKIKIGLVTGANPFFVINKSLAESNSLREESLLPVLSKYRSAKGLAFTEDDYEDSVRQGERAYLVHTVMPPRKNSPLARYLELFPSEDRDKVSTFKKRAIWHAPDDGKIPDAFFPVMNDQGPRLVLNDCSVNCTNTIHRAFFDDHLSPNHRKLLAISLLTSFSQLSAEFVGRRYGSGVLKHEPREAENIQIVVPTNISEEDIACTYVQIDALLRAGSLQEAHRIADELIFTRGLNLPSAANTFALALEAIRELRRTNRHRSGV